MIYIEVLLIILALCLDIFAVSISIGGAMENLQLKDKIKIAIIFTLFHSTFPLIGWFGGVSISAEIDLYDHWISLILLTMIGGKMIHESFKDTENRTFNPMKTGVLIGIAIATSVDALVVGLTLAFMKVDIIITLLLLALSTFAISLSGINLGKRIIKTISTKYIDLLGGLILIAIGIKIFIEHTA